MICSPFTSGVIDWCCTQHLQQRLASHVTQTNGGLPLCLLPASQRSHFFTSLSPFLVLTFTSWHRSKMLWLTGTSELRYWPSHDNRQVGHLSMWCLSSVAGGTLVGLQQALCRLWCFSRHGVQKECWQSRNVTRDWWSVGWVHSRQWIKSLRSIFECLNNFLRAI